MCHKGAFLFIVQQHKCSNMPKMKTRHFFIVTLMYQFSNNVTIKVQNIWIVLISAYRYEAKDKTKSFFPTSESNITEEEKKTV